MANSADKKATDGASSLETIRTAFERYFDTPEIKLPSSIPHHGVVKGGGWYVTYLLDQTESDKPYLDFFAENRFTNSRHVRITATGKIVELENYQEAIILPPGEDDWGKASAQRAVYNNKVTEILQSKGLLP